MKIVILESARGDLAAGAAFYETQEKGLGEYFRESLISDIDSLETYEAFTKAFSDFIVCCLSDFHTQFTMQQIKRKFLSEPSLIAGEIQIPCGTN